MTTTLLACIALAAAGPPEAGFSLALEPATAPQGSIVVARATPIGEQALRGVEARFAGTSSRGFKWHGGDWLALVPVPIAQRLGTQRVGLHVVDGRGVLHKAEVLLTVVPGKFDTDVLGVGKRFLDPSAKQRAQAQADAAVFEDAWKHADRERRWRGPFRLPVDNEINGTFGTFRTLNGRTRSRHMGIDVRGRVGDPILASNDGRVAVVRPCFFSGNTVVVDHGMGVFTLYFHLSRFKVKAGDRVKRGQLLGLVGDTGRVTGPHLHWSVKIARTYVDPRALLHLDLLQDPLLRPLPSRPAAVLVVDPAPPALTVDAGTATGGAVDAGPAAAVSR